MSGISTNIRQAGELAYLWPINTARNAGYRGVMRFTSGPVWVGGTVRGRVTLYVDGAVRLMAPIKLVNEPSNPDVEDCTDQLGIVAVSDILVADNVTSRARRVANSLLSSSNFNRHFGPARDVTLQGIATVAALAKAGKLRLIGVMLDQRHPEYPDTPTLKESGIQGFDFSTWFVLTAPKGTPKDIVDRLHREVVKALGDAEIQSRYAAVGLKPSGTTPEKTVQIVQEQLTRYGKAIKDNNIRAD